MPGPGGGVVHAEMQVAAGVVMRSPSGGSDHWRSAKAFDGAVTQGRCLYVAPEDMQPPS